MCKKDVLIKISYVDDIAELDEFLRSVKAIGLEPDEIREKLLPLKPVKSPGKSTKDVKITVAGNADETNDIINEFLERAEKELGLLPSSKNEKLLGVINESEKR